MQLWLWKWLIPPCVSSPLFTLAKVPVKAWSGCLTGITPELFPLRSDPVWWLHVGRSPVCHKSQAWKPIYRLMQHPVVFRSEEGETWVRHKHTLRALKHTSLTVQQSIWWHLLTQAEQVLNNHQVNEEEVLVCVCMCWIPLRKNTSYCV